MVNAKPDKSYLFFTKKGMDCHLTLTSHITMNPHFSYAVIRNSKCFIRWITSEIGPSSKLSPSNLITFDNPEYRLSFHLGFLTWYQEWMKGPPLISRFYGSFGPAQDVLLSCSVPRSREIGFTRDICNLQVQLNGVNIEHFHSGKPILKGHNYVSIG